jgi:hypothetical protein
VLFDGFSDRFMSIPDDTESYRFRVAPDGKTVLIKIRDKGECRLVFETGSMARRENRMAVTLPYFNALTASAVITIPVVDLDVECSGALWKKTETAEGSTTAEFILGPRTMLDGKNAWGITWQPRARDTKAEKPVVYATFTSVAQLKPGVVETFVQAAFNVVQGEARMFAMSLPENMTVIDVKHPKLATWRFDPPTRRVEAVMSQPLAGMTTLTLTLQTACPPAPAELVLSVPSAESVDRQSGRIAIAAPESLLVRTTAPEGVIAVDAADFKGIVKGALDALRRTFRYDDPKAVRIPLGIEDVQAELTVQETSSFSLGDERSILSSTLNVTVTRAGVFGVRLVLPEGYEIESLAGPAVSHWDDSRAAGRGIEVWFSGRILDTTPIHLVLSSTLRGVPPAFAVPNVALTGARRHTGRMAVATERGVKLTVDKQDGVSLNRDEPQRGAAMVFNLLRPDWKVTLNAEVLPPVLKPDMLHRVDLAEGMLQHRIYAHYRIANAGVRFFRIRIPDPAATLTVSGQNIARVRAVEDEAVGQSALPLGRTWEIELHGKVEGTYNFVAQYQEPYDAAAGSATIKPVTLLDTARQASWLAVTCSGRIEVAPKGDTAGLKVEDARALPADFNAGDISSAILCYRALREEYTLALSVVRHAAAEVLPAMVEQVRLVSVISSGGRLLTQTTLMLDPGHMRFLRVALPDANATLWSAIVNGAEVPVSFADGTLNIPLETATVGRKAEVVLIYADALGSASLLGDHAPRAPPFPDLPLKDIQWRFFVPPDFRYAFPDSAFQRDTNARPQHRAFAKQAYDEYNRYNTVSSLSKARSNLESLDGLIAGNQQGVARQVLQQAVNLSQAEATLNEDARVQFRNVVQQQVKMGLVNRRANIRIDNNIYDGSNSIDVSAYNGGNFDANYARQVEDQLDASDRAGLDLVARRLVDMQASAATQGASIQVVMPEHGEEFTFTRPLQNELGGELTIPFRAIPARTWGSLLALWPLLPGALLIWLMLGFLFGFRRRGIVVSD